MPAIWQNQYDCPQALKLCKSSEILLDHYGFNNDSSNKHSESSNSNTVLTKEVQYNYNGWNSQEKLFYVFYLTKYLIERIFCNIQTLRD